MTHQLLRPSRRQFIKTFMVGSAFSLLDGMPWKARFIAEVNAVGPGLQGNFPINLSRFPALLNQNGSVRLTFNPVSGQAVFGQYYPIIVTRGPGDTFYVLSSYCQHAGCAVPPYSVAEGAIVCPCHGSRYAIDGTLIQGPSPAGLPSYNYTYDGDDMLCVQYPDVDLRPGYLTVKPVGAGSTRLRIQWLGVEQAPYQVHFRSKIDDPPQMVSFSTTPNGPIDTTMIYGTNQFVQAYVDVTADAGFYSVALLITEA